MAKTHRSFRTCKSRVRKYNGKCEECGKSVCSCSIYQYVDESNAAISNNSLYLCYSKNYNVKIMSPIENYKKRLINKFFDYWVYKKAKSRCIFATMQRLNLVISRIILCGEIKY